MLDPHKPEKEGKINFTKMKRHQQRRITKAY